MPRGQRRRTQAERDFATNLESNDASRRSVTQIIVKYPECVQATGFYQTVQETHEVYKIHQSNCSLNPKYYK